MQRQRHRWRQGRLERGHEDGEGKSELSPEKEKDYVKTVGGPVQGEGTGIQERASEVRGWEAVPSRAGDSGKAQGMKDLQGFYLVTCQQMWISERDSGRSEREPGCGREARRGGAWMVMQVRNKEAAEMKQGKQTQEIFGSRIQKTERSTVYTSEWEELAQLRSDSFRQPGEQRCHSRR